MFKMIGIVLLVTATTMYGKEKALTLQKNIKKAMVLERLLLFIENNIYHLRKPLEEIFSDIKKYHYFHEIVFLNNINTEDYYINIKDEFKTSIKASNENINTNIKNIFIDFINNIGDFSAEEEIKKIDYYKKLLKSEIEILKEEKERNSKIYTGVGFFVGVTVSIFIM